MARGKWLSEEEKLRIVEMHKSGLSAGQIAKQMERGVKSIQRVLNPPQEPIPTISLSDFPTPTYSDPTPPPSASRQYVPQAHAPVMQLQPANLAAHPHHAPYFETYYQVQQHQPHHATASIHAPNAYSIAPGPMHMQHANGQTLRPVQVQHVPAPSVGRVQTQRPKAPARKTTAKQPPKQQDHAPPLRDTPEIRHKISTSSSPSKSQVRERKSAVVAQSELHKPDAVQVEAPEMVPDEHADEQTSYNEDFQPQPNSSSTVRRPPRLVEPAAARTSQEGCVSPMSAKSMTPIAVSAEAATPVKKIIAETQESPRAQSPSTNDVHRVESTASSQSESESQRPKKRKIQDSDIDAAKSWSKPFATAMAMLESAVWNLKRSGKQDTFDERLCLLIERFQIEVSLHEFEKKRLESSSSN